LAAIIRTIFSFSFCKPDPSRIISFTKSYPEDSYFLFRYSLYFVTIIRVDSIVYNYYRRRRREDVEEKIFDVAQKDAGQRLDRYLAALFPDLSRGAIQRAIRREEISFNHTHGIDKSAVPKRLKPAFILQGGERIIWKMVERPSLVPRRLDITIIYKDNDILIIDKPSGLVVHPGAGTKGVTLVEGLLMEQELPVGDDPIRPGIVHRLDKETSGVMVVALTSLAMEDLKQQFAAHRVVKRYLAVVDGVIVEDKGMIDSPVGRDIKRPWRMAVAAAGRSSQTEFRVLKRSAKQTLLLITPKSGRTHQIRVHMSHIGHPVYGDLLYGGTKASRLFLHSWRLAMFHPQTKEWMKFTTDVPLEFLGTEVQGS
jgi:23S rRNA pseudouridine1911/1915/1917 synthase